MEEPGRKAMVGSELIYIAFGDGRRALVEVTRLAENRLRLEHPMTQPVSMRR